MRTSNHAAELARRLGQSLAIVALVATVAGTAAATPSGLGTAPATAPGTMASSPLLAPHGPAMPRAKKPAEPVKWVDINSASRAELKTLPGIGDAEADRIIKNRPYLSKTELVSKKVLPTGPYIALKGRVVAMQKIPKPGKR